MDNLIGGGAEWHRSPWSEEAGQPHANSAAAPELGTGVCEPARFALAQQHGVLLQRLSEQEDAQASAASHAHASEMRLKDAVKELERVSSLAAPTPGAQHGEDVGRQLAEVRMECEERTCQLRDSGRRLDLGASELVRLRADGSAHARASSVLKAESAAAGGQLAAGLEDLGRARRALETLRRRRADTVLGREAEVHWWSRRLQDLTGALQRSRAKLAAAEAAGEASRAEMADCEAGLVQAAAARRELLAQAGRRAADQQQLACAARGRASGLGIELAGLSSQVRGAHLVRQELEERRARSQRQLEEAMQELRTVQGRNHESRSRLAELRAHADELAWQLRDERAQGAELSRELMAAQEAARQAHLPLHRSLGGNPRPGHLSGKRQSHLRHDNRGSTLVDVHYAGGGEMSLHTRDCLQRELQELRSWKREAAGSVQRLSDGLQTVRRSHEKQLHYGRELEAGIARLGRNAQTAAVVGCPSSVSRLTAAPVSACTL